LSHSTNLIWRPAVALFERFIGGTIAAKLTALSIASKASVGLRKNGACYAR
jgi:hypothetical protein